MGRMLVRLLLLLVFLVPAASAVHAGAGGEDPPGVCSMLPIAVAPPLVTGFIADCREYVLLPGRPSESEDSGFAIDPSVLLNHLCSSSECRSGSSAEALRCLALHGFPCCPESGLWVPVVRGNRSIPIADGVRARWEMDSDQRSGICYSDYHGSGQRVVRVFVGLGNASHPRVMLGGRWCRFFLARPPLRPGDDLIGQFLGWEFPY